MKNKVSFWQIVFYTSLAILTVWLILKVIGVIQTPVWLEYGVPIASLIATILAFYKEILDKINLVVVGLATINVKVDHIDNDVDVLKEDMGIIKDKVSVLEHKI